jgi:hypothetical protein
MVGELTQRLRATEQDLHLATSAVEGAVAGMGTREPFGDAVAARKFDAVLTQTKLECVRLRACVRACNQSL